VKVYTTDRIRNVALAGHSAAGKTTIAEALLFERKHIDRMGRTEDGTTQSDFLPEEIRRQISISASILPVETGNVKINLVDLPGFRDFVGEIKGGMRVCGGVVVVVDAMGGIEVGTEFALDYAREMDIPVIFFINKLDKEHASYEACLERMKEALPHKRFVPITIPIGEQGGLQGVVDLVKMKAIYEKDGVVRREEIPASLIDKAKALHETEADEAASDDEALAEKFLSGAELSPEDIILGLKTGFVNRQYFPVFCGSALKAIGIQSLMDFIETGFPNPSEAHGLELVNKDTGFRREVHFKDDGPATLFVFKTLNDKYGDHNFFKVVSGVVKRDMILRNLSNDRDERIGHLYTQRGKNHEEVEELHAGDIGAVMKLASVHTNDTLAGAGSREFVTQPHYPQPTVTMALVAANRPDEEKVGEAARRLAERDPTLSLERDPITHELLVRGMGDMHLDVMLSRIQALQKLECSLKIPRTPYRETVLGRAEGSHRHKKQSGGRGQFGEVYLRVMPGEPGVGLDFRWKVVGGVVPTKYESAVRKGIEQSMARGIVSGNQVVDVAVECFDGKQHDVDSSDMAFSIASSVCFQKVAAEAKPVILEPIAAMRIIVPEEYLGSVMGDLSGKRGRILGQDRESEHKVVVEAHVPLAEVYEYSKQLRSMTQGRGVFELSIDRYERVPPEVQARLIEEHAKHRTDNGEEH